MVGTSNQSLPEMMIFYWPFWEFDMFWPIGGKQMDHHMVIICFSKLVALSRGEGWHGVTDCTCVAKSRCAALNDIFLGSDGTWYATRDLWAYNDLKIVYVLPVIIRKVAELLCFTATSDVLSCQEEKIAGFPLFHGLWPYSEIIQLTFTNAQSSFIKTTSPYFHILHSLLMIPAIWGWTNEDHEG